MKKTLIILCLFMFSCDNKGSRHIIGENNGAVDSHDFIIIQDINGDCFSINGGTYTEIKECDCN